MDPTQPPWLQDLINRMYPGYYPMDQDYLRQLINKPAAPSAVTNNGNPVMGSSVTAAGTPIATINPQTDRSSFNTPLPPPDPRRVGGNPSVMNQSPGNASLAASPNASPNARGVIPGQQRVNRAGNSPPFSTNPNIVEFNPQVGGVGQSGRNGPIYTALNLQNLFGGGSTPAGHPSVTSQPSSSPTQGILSKAPWSMGPLQQGMVFPSQMGPYRPSGGVDPALYGG